MINKEELVLKKIISILIANNQLCIYQSGWLVLFWNSSYSCL